MTEPLYGSSAPVFEVGGEVRGELARDLLGLEIREDVRGLRTLELRLVAHGPREGEPEEGLLYLDGETIRFGEDITVSVGPAGRDREVFDGRISAIEAVFEEGELPEVVVFGEDRLMDLRMTRRMRTYTDSTDADIVRALASEHGLRAEVEVDGPTYDVVQQWNMSDLAFLRERAELTRAELWARGDTLHFASRSRRSGESLTLVQGNQLLRASLRADLAHQRTEVTVSGFDAARRERIHETADAVAVMVETVGGGLTGAEVLARSFGSRASHRVREAPLVAPEAREWADAEMRRRGRRFVTVSGTTRGTPELDVGSRLTLERVGAPFEGEGYYVTSVRHTYDMASGHRTHFDAERTTVNGSMA